MEFNGASFSLALVLTGLSGVLTYLFWRSRGWPALVKGAGITLLPMALYLTGTLGLLGTLVDELASFATGLVFSPRVWTGVVLAVVAVLLVAGGTALRKRQGEPVTRKERRAAKAAEAAEGGDGAALSASTGSSSRGTPAPKAAKKKRSAPGDDEMDEIEALLRKRGIS